MALPDPPDTLITGLAALPVMLMVPPPLISSPGDEPVPVAWKPCRLIVPELPLPVNAAPELTKVTDAFAIVMLPLLFTMLMPDAPGLLSVKSPTAGTARDIVSDPAVLRAVTSTRRPAVVLLI